MNDDSVQKLIDLYGKQVLTLHGFLKDPIDVLKAEAWSAATNGVEVRIFDETETLVEAHEVFPGR